MNLKIVIKLYKNFNNFSHSRSKRFIDNKDVDIIDIDTTVDHRMITISTKIIMDLERIVVDLLVGTLDSAIHQSGMREESLVLILLLCIS
jgi:hypothetical protein